jgi:hypothetical protein
MLYSDLGAFEKWNEKDKMLNSLLRLSQKQDSLFFNYSSSANK